MKNYFSLLAKLRVVLVCLMLLPGGVLCSPAILSAEQAFPLQIRADQHYIKVQWNIAPGYYLYDDRISFSSDNLKLGRAQFPTAKAKYNEILGDYGVFEGVTKVNIPYLPTNKTSASLYIGYQGCSEEGFCYPPQFKKVRLYLPKSGDPDIIELTDYNPNNIPQNRFDELLQNATLIWILIAFFIAGMLLALTPCVLPMIPILSSIILGQQHLSTRHAFLLSSIYVLAMATTYAIAGIAAGLIGSNIQAALQLPWVIILFSLLFAGLALSMFDVYEFRLPHKFNNYLHNLSHRHQHRKNYVGIVLMGIISSLIVSPCITAPLAGALAYIGQTGDALLGGLALFSLGIGMGLPLIIIGTLGGKFLPRHGKWMLRSKHIAGFLLLGLAILTLSRFISGSITLAIWGGLAFIIAIYCWLYERNRFSIICGIFFMVYAVVAWIGAAQHHTDPLRPLAKPISAPNFINVKNVADVETVLAKSKGKIVLLDFYADWCVACHFMDKKVFGNVQVQKALENVILLRADVTMNDKTDHALQKRFSVFAPPTIIIFDQQGNIIHVFIGEISAKELLAELAH